MNVEKKLDKEISAFCGKLKRNNQVLFHYQSPVKSYADFLNNKGAVISAISAGISFELFDLIREFVPLPENYWHSALGISYKTLQRYEMQKKVFSTVQSEKIIGASEVTFRGLDTFGNMDTFTKWLDEPSLALGRLKPIELLKYTYGKAMITAELNLINHGILS